MASQTRSVNNTVSSEWANPDNAFAEDDLCTSTSTKDAQNVYNFANNLFSIPADNEVYGIVAKAVRGGDADDFYWLDLRDDTATWRYGDGTAFQANCTGAAAEYLGGEADLWEGTFSRAHVNSAEFRVRLTFKASGKANTLYVDHIEVTVYYGPVLPKSTTDNATTDPFQRKSFYAAGRHWIWYSDGVNLVFHSSTDGLTWSDKTSVGAGAQGWHSSVFFDGTFVHYARVAGIVLFYRRGTPQSDGTINWSADEQIVYNVSTTDRFEYPMIAVDSGGYAWIGARYYDGTNYLPKVLKNANIDGTWSTAIGFPYQLNATSNMYWKVAVVSLTSQRVYLVYAYTDGFARGRLYDGSWGAEEGDLGDYTVDFASDMSATGEDDDVHFAYVRSDLPHQVRYNKRTYGVGWQAADELVQDNVPLYTASVLSLDLATGDVYCFWAGYPTADHIYYKKRVSGVWDASPTDWIDESTDALTDIDILTCFPQAYGGYIGLLYMTKTASPYHIKYAYLTLAVAYEASVRLIGTVLPLYKAQVRNVGTVIAPFSSLVRLIGSVYRSYSVQVRNIGTVILPYSSLARLIGTVIAPFSARVRNIGTIIIPYSALVRLIGSVYRSYSARVRLIGTVALPYSAQVRNIGSVYRSFSAQVRNIGILTPRVVVEKCHAELRARIRRIF